MLGKKASRTLCDVFRWRNTPQQLVARNEGSPRYRLFSLPTKPCGELGSGECHSLSLSDAKKSVNRQCLSQWPFVLHNVYGAAPSYEPGRLSPVARRLVSNIFAKLVWFDSSDFFQCRLVSSWTCIFSATNGWTLRRVPNPGGIASKWWTSTYTMPPRALRKRTPKWNR